MADVIAYVHHRLFARAMALALTHAPIEEAVAALGRLASHKPDALRKALECAEESAWRDPEQRQRAVGLLELALDDLATRYEATG